MWQFFLEPVSKLMDFRLAPCKNLCTLGHQRRDTDGRKLRRYKRRWTVERTFAWLQDFRRLVIRSAFAFWRARR